MDCLARATRMGPLPRPRGARRLDDDVVAVWVCRTPTLNTDERAAMDAVLSPAERDRRDRLVFDRDRRDFTAAHALLRSALSCCGPLAASEWSFRSDRHGKPSLVHAQARESRLAFSLSHTRGVVACAVAKGASVGIDVESGTHVVDALSLARRYFAPQEFLGLSACAPIDRPARFVELWALKEAFVKAVGGGLGVPLDSFSFSYAAAAGLTFTGQSYGGPWRFWLASVGHCARLAVAARFDAGEWPRRVVVTDCSADRAFDVVPLRASGKRPAAR